MGTLKRAQKQPVRESVQNFLTQVTMGDRNPQNGCI